MRYIEIGVCGRSTDTILISIFNKFERVKWSIPKKKSIFTLASCNCCISQLQFRNLKRESARFIAGANWMRQFSSPIQQPKLSVYSEFVCRCRFQAWSACHLGFHFPYLQLKYGVEMANKLIPRSTLAPPVTYRLEGVLIVRVLSQVGKLQRK